MADTAKGGKKSSSGVIKKAAATGSGKEKYQNVTKEARTGDVRISKVVVAAKNVVRKAEGKSEMNPQQEKAVRRAEPNLAKEIDREEKVARGQRTESPSTPRVPKKGSQADHHVNTKYTYRGGAAGGAVGSLGVGGDMLEQTR